MKLARLIETKEVIVCCGAGGVGKTTTSAALALAAAQRGRRALVLTIDPARRLAQALGIPPTGRQPVRIAPTLLDAAGATVPPSGELHAWMLDPAIVLEGVVDRFAPSAEAAARIRKTRLYGALSEVMAGLQEYTAAEALYDFNEQGRFDLIVLDTPPSRNALDFLDAPRRLARFLDERTLAIFAPDPNSPAGAVVRAASKIVATAMSKAFSEEFVTELQQFLGAFGTLFGKMRLHAEGVRRLLKSDRAAFIVLASPEEAALDEAMFFKGRIKELGLISEGFILNRSYADERKPEHPSQIARSLDPDAAVLRSALEKLVPLAENELRRTESDRLLLDRLEAEGRRDHGQGAMALPYLDETVEDLAALAVLARHILASA
jgi:anion-transporting  ArsA/GET3 family ATPase